MALTPQEQDRDAFFKQWHLKELLFQHLVSKAAYAVQDHAIIWGRVNTVFTGWLALVGGCIWLHAAALKMPYGWVVHLPLLICDTFLVRSLLRVLKAANPAYQMETHTLQGLKTGWEASRQKVRERTPSLQDDSDQMKAVESGLLLANWYDVAESAVTQNKDRYEHVNASFKLLVWAIRVFVIAVVLWLLISAVQAERNVMAEPNPKDPPVDVEIVHPITEITEKGDPDTVKK